MGRAAFTLLELMLAVAVLALLIVLVAQLINSATLTTTESRKHMDAESEARTILDRLGNDLGRMVKRSDVDCFLKGGSIATATMEGNDSLFFFSETIGYFSGASVTAQSPLTLVGYRINPTATPGTPGYVLERLGQALAWGDGSGAESMAFLTYAANGTTPDPASTIGGRWPDIVDGNSDDYQAIGAQVFRFEYCYLLKNGTLSNKPFIPPHTSIQGAQDILAIVVAIAILDNTSRKIAPDLGVLSKALSDPTDAQLAQTPPILMAQTWRNAINTSGFASTVGLPQSAIGHIRVYQRFYYLGNQ